MAPAGPLEGATAAVPEEVDICKREAPPPEDSSSSRRARAGRRCWAAGGFAHYYDTLSEQISYTMFNPSIGSPESSNQFYVTAALELLDNKLEARREMSNVLPALVQCLEDSKIGKSAAGEACRHFIAWFQLNQPKASATTVSFDG